VMVANGSRPGFFIVGAPKCGTTALYTWLDQHPGVFISKPKEPDWFGRDIERVRPTTSSHEQTLSWFHGAAPAS
jgi:Sulfotransferase family